MKIKGSLTEEGMVKLSVYSHNIPQNYFVDTNIDWEF